MIALLHFSNSITVSICVLTLAISVFNFVRYRRLAGETLSLERANAAQADLIGNYCSQISAAKDQGIHFEWEGPIAIAINERAEEAERKLAELEKGSGVQRNLNAKS